MSKRILMTLLVAVVALGFLGSSALAEIIVHHPVGSNESSYYTISGVLPQDAWNLWNEENHDPNPAKRVERPDLADPSTWYIDNHVNQGWMSQYPPATPPVVGEWVLLDLGAEYDLDTIDIWNYYQSNSIGRGTKDFSVWKADDLAGTVSAATALCTGTLAQGHDAPEYYQQFALTGATDVRYVKIVVGSNYGDANCVGLGFVTFEENVVPEPSTFALLAAGLLGLLAYAWRRRK